MTMSNPKPFTTESAIYVALADELWRWDGKTWEQIKKEAS